MPDRIGTPLTAPARIQHTDIPQPIAYSDEIAGSLWRAANLAAMHAIPNYMRQDDAGNPLWGATCYIHSDVTPENNGRWELAKVVSEDITDNANWQKVAGGSGGGSVTAVQVRDLYESNEDRNPFTDAEKLKLAGISGMSAGQIKTSYESNANTNAFTDSEKTKLAQQSGTNTGDETDGSIKGKLLNNPDTHVLSTAEKTKLTDLQGVNTGDETPESVQTKLLANANTELYTTAEKAKLAGLEEAKWKGSYTTLAGLQAAYPIGEAGWEADVDAGVGDPVQRYIWDESDQQWEAQVGESTTETAASIKAKYESNPDTNAYNDVDKAKVAATSGTNSGDETALSVKNKYLANDDTNNLSDALLGKLNGIEAGATADQTPAEIAAAYHTVANEYSDGDMAKVDNVPSNTNNELALKQAAIDALELLMASDNASLDTLQKIVDFIEALDVETGGKLDDISQGTNVTIDKTNPNNPVISANVPAKANQATAELGTDDAAYMTALKVLQSVAQRAGFGLEWNASTKKFEFGITGTPDSGHPELYKIIDVGEIGVLEIAGGFASEFHVNLEGAGARGFKVDIGAGTVSDVSSFQVYDQSINLNTGTGSSAYFIRMLTNLFKLDAVVTQVSGIFQLQGSATLETVGASPESLVNKEWVEQQITNAGGSGLQLATEAENIAGTNNTKASSPLGVVQNIEARVGNGLTWDDVAKTVNLGGSFLNDTIFLTTYLEEPEGHPTESFYENWGIHIYKRASSVNTQEARIEYKYNTFDVANFPGGYTIDNFVSAGKAGIVINSDSGGFNILLGDQDTFDGEVTNHAATITDQRSQTKGLEYDGDYSAEYTERSLVDKGYSDKTQIGTELTASKTFALTDAGGKKITPVNSASNLVYTIPADATTNFPIGSTINLRRRGTGTVEIVGAVGVSLEGIADTNGDYLIKRYGVVSAYKEAANLWVVYGALEA